MSAASSLGLYWQHPPPPHPAQLVALIRIFLQAWLLVVSLLGDKPGVLSLACSTQTCILGPEFLGVGTKGCSGTQGSDSLRSASGGCLLTEVTWAAAVGDGAGQVPGMRASAVGCAGNCQGGVKVIWSWSQVLSFQAGQPSLNEACTSPSLCCREGRSRGSSSPWRKAGHTFPND